MLLGFVAEAQDRATPVFQRIGNAVDELRRKYDGLIDGMKAKLQDMASLNIGKITELITSGIVASKGIQAYRGLTAEIQNAAMQTESATFLFTQTLKQQGMAADQAKIKALETFKTSLELAEKTPLAQQQVIDLYVSMAQVGTQLDKTWGKVGDYVKDAGALSKDMTVTNVSLVTDLAAMFAQTGARFDNFVYGMKKAVMSGGKDLMILRDNISPEATARIFGKGGKTATKIYEDMFAYLKEKQALGLSAAASETIDGIMAGMKDLKTKFIQNLIGDPNDTKSLLNTYKQGITDIYTKLSLLFTNQKFMDAMKKAIVPAIKLGMSFITKFVDMIVWVGNFLGKHPWIAKVLVGFTMLITIVPIVIALLSALGIIMGFLLAKTLLVGVALVGLISRFKFITYIGSILFKKGPFSATATLAIEKAGQKWWWFSYIVDFLVLSFKKLKDVASGIVGKISSLKIFKSFTAGAKGAGGLFAGVVSKLSNISWIKPIITGIQTVITWFKNLFILVKTGAINILGRLPFFDKIIKFFNFIKGGIGGILGRAFSFIISKLTWILSIFNIIRGITQIWQNNIWGIQDLFKKGGNTLSSFILRPVQWLYDFFKKIYHTVKMFFDIILKGGFYLEDYMALGDSDAWRIIKFFTTDLGKFLRSIGVLIFKFQKFFELMGKVFDFMGTGTREMGMIGGGIGSVIGMLVGGPLGALLGGLAGTGIGALVAGIINAVTNWDKFVEGVNKLKDDFIKNILPAFEVFKMYMERVFGKRMTDAFVGFLKNFKDIFIGIFTYFKGVFEIVFGIGQLIVGIFSKNEKLRKEAFNNIAKGIVDIFKGFFQIVTNALKMFDNMFVFLNRLFRSIVVGVIKLIQDVFIDIIANSPFSALIKPAQEFFGGLIKWVEGFYDIWLALRDLIVAIFTGGDILGALGSLWGGIWKSIDGLAQSFLGLGAFIVKGIAKGIEVIQPMIKEGLGNLLTYLGVGDLIPVVSAMVDGVLNVFKSIFTFAGSIFDIALRIKDVVVALFTGGDISSAMLNLGKSLIEIFKNAFFLVTDLIVGMFTGILGTIWGTIQGLFGGNRLANLIEGFFEWINQGLQNLDEWLKGLMPPGLYALFHLGISFIQLVVGTVGRTFSTVLRIVSSIVETIGKVFKWVQPLVETFKRIVQYIMDLVGTVAGFVFKAVGDLVEQLFSPASWKAIWDGFKNITDKFLGTMGLKVDWEDVEKFFVKVSFQIAQWSTDIYNSIKKGFENAWVFISTWFDNIGRAFNNIFSVIIETINRVIASGYNILIALENNPLRKNELRKQQMAAENTADTLRAEREMTNILARSKDSKNLYFGDPKKVDLLYNKLMTGAKTDVSGEKGNKIMNIYLGDVGNFSKEELAMMIRDIFKKTGMTKALQDFLDNGDLVIHENGTPAFTIDLGGKQW